MSLGIIILIAAESRAMGQSPIIQIMIFPINTAYMTRPGHKQPAVPSYFIVLGHQVLYNKKDFLRYLPVLVVNFFIGLRKS